MASTNTGLDGFTFQGLRTCIVSDWLTVPGGAEEVVRNMYELVPAPIYTAQYNPEKFPWLAEAEVHTSWVTHLPLSKTKHYLYAPILADAYRGLDLSQYDLIICSSHTFGHQVKQCRPDAKVLVYYHTPARALWTPEIDGRAGSGAVRQAIVRRLKRLDLEAAGRPNHILANSQTTADRIQKFYGRTTNRVVYPPVDVDKFADVRPTSGEEGFLMWGRMIPYKRIDLAIQAAIRTGDRLNLVGNGPERPKLEALAAGHDNIVFHGRLSDQDLKSLMSRTRAVLFPGYEDFGIVPVEAMAAGLPVVAYAQGGAAESVLPSCGVHLHEQSVDALAASMQAVQSREFDPDHLKENAQRFSVDVFKSAFQEEVTRLALADRIAA